MRVALLGGHGFAGRHILKELEAYTTVRAFSRATGCDLLYLDSAQQQLDYFRPTHIVNCAADTGSIQYVSAFAADVCDRNMIMLLNVFKIASKLKAILVSPVASCGYPGEADLYREESFWDGSVHESVLGFGVTRRMIDALSDCYARQYSLDNRMLFVPNMYGPGDSVDPARTHALNALVVKFLRAKQTGAANIELWGSGKPIREWLYVKDLARLVRKIVVQDIPVRKLNIGQESGLSINEIAETIRQAVGFDGEVVRDTTKPDGAPVKIMSGVRFKEHFPVFRFTSMQKGISETVEFYRSAISPASA